ncbi:MAG: hypothetical protein WDN00_15715 [Limisphaerales bacterium]
MGTGIWHYIDLPFSLDGTSTSGVVPSSFDVGQGDQLKHHQSKKHPPSPRATRPVSLRYLIHFCRRHPATTALQHGPYGLQGRAAMPAAIRFMSPAITGAIFIRFGILAAVTCSIHFPARFQLPRRIF